MNNFPQLENFSIKNLHPVYRLDFGQIAKTSWRSIFEKGQAFPLKKMSVQIDSISASALLYLLSSCPHLQELSITSIYWDRYADNGLKFLLKKNVQVGSKLRKVSRLLNPPAGALDALAWDMKGLIQFLPLFSKATSLTVEYFDDAPLEDYDTPSETTDQLFTTIATHLISLRNLVMINSFAKRLPAPESLLQLRRLRSLKLKGFYLSTQMKRQLYKKCLRLTKSNTIFE